MNEYVKNKFLKLFVKIVFVFTLIFCCIMAGCSTDKKDIIIGEDNPPAPHTEAGIDFSKYAGKRIGVTTGSVQEKYVNDKVPNGKCAYYDDEPAMAVALKQEKIDAFIMPYISSKELLANNPELIYDPVPVGVDWISQCFSKSDKGRKLQAEFNEFITEIKENGELERLTNKWNGDPSGWSSPDFSILENNTKIINYGCYCTLMPFCFMGDGKYQGLDMDFMLEFCKKYGYKLNIDYLPIASVILGLTTNVYDMGGGGIAYNKERAESVLFGLPYYNSAQVFIVHKASYVSGSNFIDLIKNEFEKTFVVQSRWKLFLSGIGTTFFITIFAFIIGAAFGIGICALMLSKSKIFNGIADWYIKIFQGIPPVVILMVFCYVVFAKLEMDEVMVAIIGFALLVGSETGEIYYHSIKSIDIGQKEAGLAIGLTLFQDFIGIILPQAMKNILPGYKNCFVALLKATAIAGYIAVQDLTKMSDIIRSRTYSAFFPLISTAIIYFIISFIITKILEKVIKSIEPKREKRCIKGVIVHD